MFVVERDCDHPAPRAGPRSGGATRGRPRPAPRRPAPVRGSGRSRGVSLPSRTTPLDDLSSGPDRRAKTTNPTSAPLERRPREPVAHRISDRTVGLSAGPRAGLRPRRGRCKGMFAGICRPFWAVGASSARCDLITRSPRSPPMTSSATTAAIRAGNHEPGPTRSTRRRTSRPRAATRYPAPRNAGRCPRTRKQRIVERGRTPVRRRRPTMRAGHHQRYETGPPTPRPPATARAGCTAAEHEDGEQ